MKKIAVAALTILAMLFSVLPVSGAVAKKDIGYVFLYVRNRTGGKVHIVLADPNGKKTIFDYPEGLYKESVTQALYTYYIITPCQKLAGVMNLNVTKQLYFACNQGVNNESSSKLPVPPVNAVWSCLQWSLPSSPPTGNFSTGSQTWRCLIWGWRR